MSAPLRAVVLAAGRGARMGGPKALLPWGGTVLAVAHARALAAAGARPVVLVVRAEVARALAHRGEEAPFALLVSTLADALGPAGSLRAFASTVPIDPVARYVITPVDSLPASVDLVDSLLDALAALPAGSAPRAARPVHAGRGGHPVVVEGALLARFRDELPPPTLRVALGALGDRVAVLEVPDPRVGVDLDTPAELRRWSP